MNFILIAKGKFKFQILFWFIDWNPSIHPLTDSPLHSNVGNYERSRHEHPRTGFCLDERQTHESWHQGALIFGCFWSFVSFLFLGCFWRFEGTDWTRHPRPKPHVRHTRTRTHAHTRNKPNMILSSYFPRKEPGYGQGCFFLSLENERKCIK